jgi:hypothetical protein
MLAGGKQSRGPAPPLASCERTCLMAPSPLPQPLRPADPQWDPADRRAAARRCGGRARRAPCLRRHGRGFCQPGTSIKERPASRSTCDSQSSENVVMAELRFRTIDALPSTAKSRPEAAGGAVRCGVVRGSYKRWVRSDYYWRWRSPAVTPPACSDLPLDGSCRAAVPSRSSTSSPDI